METKPESIIINSCEYTPVYFVPSTSVTQAGSYILAPSLQEPAKPVTDNLKRFYENSGKLNGGVLSSPKPRILKKQAPTVTGNNLKLASFLLPKSDGVAVKKELVQSVPTTNNIILKPVTTAVAVTNVVNNVNTTNNVTNTVNTVAKVEVDRKIVRVGTIPIKAKPQVRTIPKILSKECIPIPAATSIQTPTPNPLKANHTSVQLLKLGETYHSLNQLSSEQMKIVNQALKMFSNGEKVPEEPAYDPITNTKFFYKIVSPRDLTVVGKNTIEVKQKKEMKRPIIKKIEKKDNVAEDLVVAEPKVTRSGRTVKLPKTMRSEESPKPRKKCSSVVNCFQCSAEFGSLYRLQRHYETYPTHIPAKIHSNLFHCLLAIIKSGSAEDQANIFIQQLQQLIDKLKALVPCLLKEVAGKERKPCNISEEIGRIFGLDPGKYNFNIDALNCVKDKDGCCVHHPAPKVNPADTNDPVSANTEEMDVQETEDCARINSVDKWPSVSKRMLKIKQQKSERMKAKRIRLASDNNDQNIEPGTDDLAIMAKGDSAIKIEDNKIAPGDVSEKNNEPQNDNCASDNQSKEMKNKHIQFHSTHFDIRSSPIKNSALVKKFQINGENLPNHEVQIMRPLTPENPSESTSDIVIENDDSDSLQLFREDSLKEANMHIDLNFDSSKDWPISDQTNEPSESYMKSDILFEPTLTPIKEGNVIEPSLIHIKDKTDDFFETCNKTNGLFKPSVVEKTTMIEPSFMHINNESDTLYSTNTKPNGLIDRTLTQAETKSFDNTLLEDKSNGLFEQPSKENGLLEPSFIQAKSDNFFEQTLLQMGNKCSSLFDTSPIRVKSELSLLEPNYLQAREKSNSLFEAIEHVKERSNHLFESGIQRKDKDSLIGPSMISIKAESNNFYSSTLHGKYDILIEPMNCKNLLDSGLMNDKSIDNVDVSQNDSSSNQGHSVLNFLDALGSECLSYPETEIRNHSVDFQLDLLFNSS